MITSHENLQTTPEITVPQAVIPEQATAQSVNEADIATEAVQHLARGDNGHPQYAGHVPDWGRTISSRDGMTPREDTRTQTRFDRFAQGQPIDGPAARH